MVSLQIQTFFSKGPSTYDILFLGLFANYLSISYLLLSKNLGISNSWYLIFINLSTYLPTQKLDIICAWSFKFKRQTTLKVQLTIENLMLSLSREISINWKIHFNYIFLEKSDRSNRVLKVLTTWLSCGILVR